MIAILAACNAEGDVHFTSCGGHQLYLDDRLWDALHARARSQQTTISELVREAIR